MKNLLYLLIILFAPVLASAQITAKNYFPIKIIMVNLSAERQRGIERLQHLSSTKNRTQKEEQEFIKLIDKYGEITEDAWDVINGGCSWYCGGGNYKVKASSFLSNAANDTIYTSKSANDLSYKTAWVEGKSDAGFGEYLEYNFKNYSPRITKVIISNGYMKSESNWRSNNRVKKLNMYVNGKIYGTLNLLDSRADQVFDVGTIGHNKNKTDLILRFEIAEIYKGDKYNDTAITEIYFDGIDVH